MDINIDNAIKNIANYEYSYFLNKTNVIGVGLGYKITKGINTFTKCITVFVKKKCPKNSLNNFDLIPSTYRGYLTDVIETGIAKSDSLTDRVRPVPGGYSIGPAFFNDYIGTLGCLVQDDSNTYILSCCHVIAAENMAPLGNPILQPPIEFEGESPRDIIASLNKFIPLRFITPSETPENFVDCAIARVSDLSLVTKVIHFIGAPIGTKQASLNLCTEKVGSTSEYTFGCVRTINTTMTFEYGSGNILLKNLIGTDKMSYGGDSGAILSEFNTNLALGLLIGSSSTNSFSTPIDSVLDALNVRLAT